MSCWGTWKNVWRSWRWHCDIGIPESASFHERQLTGKVTGGAPRSHPGGGISWVQKTKHVGETKKQSAHKGPGTNSIYGPVYTTLKGCTCCTTFINPSPTPNTSQTKKPSSTERKMRLSHVVLFLASVFGIVLATPLVSMHSESFTTHIWSSFVLYLERGGSKCCALFESS